MKQKELKDNLSESSGNETKTKNSLSDYVENNSKLISVLGVFTALTVFTNNLSIKPIGYALSFVFLTITIIIWVEYNLLSTQTCRVDQCQHYTLFKQGWYGKELFHLLMVKDNRKLCFFLQGW